MLQPIHIHPRLLNFCRDLSRNETRNSLRITIANNSDAAELLIYDGIGEPGTSSTAESAVAFLNAHRGKPVNVRLNSPGGSAYEGLTIFNALAQHNAAVTTTIEGIAASAAAIISQAGDTRRMFANGSLMVHRAMAMAIGNRDIMSEMVDLLDQVDQLIGLTLAARSGKSKSQLMAAMVGKDGADGTTYDAAGAKAFGLADEIIPLPTQSRLGRENHRPSHDADASVRASRQRVAARDRLAAMYR